MTEPKHTPNLFDIAKAWELGQTWYGADLAKHAMDCVSACAGMEDPEKEIDRIRKENDALRGLLGNSALPCVYCGLPANEQGKCESGFPGCPRADDQQLSHLFAIEYDNECMRKEIAKLRADKQVLVDALEAVLSELRHFASSGKKNDLLTVIIEALSKVQEKED